VSGCGKGGHQMPVKKKYKVKKGETHLGDSFGGRKGCSIERKDVIVGMRERPGQRKGESTRKNR